MHDGSPPPAADHPLAVPTEPGNHGEWMLRGTGLHAGGQLEQALLAFEQALLLEPRNVNTASACAAVLSALARPGAAYRTLLGVEAALLTDPDTAANLAIAAENCGDLAKAHSAYQQALTLNPGHVRSLNNIGLLAAAQAKWDAAIDAARSCVKLQAAYPPAWLNLADFLCAAGRYAEALEALDQAARHVPERIQLTLRRIAVLAFAGDCEASNALRGTLTAAEMPLLQDFLARWMAAPAPEADQTPPRPPAPLPDARDLHAWVAFEAMASCNWRDNPRLAASLRQALADALRTGHGRDWRGAQFYGHMLGLQEEELALMRRLSTASIGAGVTGALPPFVPRRQLAVRKDERIHVGLAVQSLRDTAYVHALQRQLDLHDTGQFAIHVYSSTPDPLSMPQGALALHPPSGDVVEIAHMSDAEAAARIRLDQLDLLVDMTFNSRACRPEILHMRVAPVQIRPLTWHRHHPPGPCDYNLSDRFIHPEGLDLTPFGPLVRLPTTCWLATHDDAPGSGRDTREAAGLPDDALVLCARMPAVTLDPQTFALWMKILRSLPDAVLWLPAYSLATAANLVRETEAAGVSAERLLFSSPMTRPDALACLKHADLFLDGLLFNANQGLADALRMGVPAISCAGQSMASRMGGSLLHAAGLPQCVFESRDAYVAGALRLGRHASALQQLRRHVQDTVPAAPLFDIAARVREWEAAWTIMADRARAGLAPATFDVPSSRTAPESAAAQAR